MMNEITIKTTEMIGIFRAILKLIGNKHKKIVIFTDSKSGCTSLINCIRNNKYKYYEEKIMELMEENPETEVIIQWIPAHVGIQGNENADVLAKIAVEEDNMNKLDNKIPMEDLNYVIKNKIREEWRNEYEYSTRSKGIFNRIINNAKPPDKTWFKTVKMKAKYIKVINRLRTGHTFNKIFKTRMKIEENNECEVCRVMETNIHVIDNCPKYKNIKKKYKNIENKKLIEVLKQGNETELKEMAKFYTEINIEI